MQSPKRLSGIARRFRIVHINAGRQILTAADPFTQ
jgi:hypothetical protein